MEPTTVKSPLPLVGLAVPYGDEVDGKRAEFLGGESIPAEVQIQNFYDHAYEFRFEPYPDLEEAPRSTDGYCAVEISALEVEPGTC